MGQFEVKCGRCYRTLRARASVARGYGRCCWARLQAERVAAILRDFTAAQIREARELIRLRAVVRLRHPGAYRVASSDRSKTYLTTAHGCNCAQYLRRLMPRPCKHNLAVRLTADRAARSAA